MSLTERPCRRGMEDLEDSLVFQLWRASNAWQRTLRRALDPLGLTHTQFVALAIADRLARVKPAVTQAMIHEVADLDENLTSQVVRSLEAKGLMRRLRHPEDGRAYSLVVTECGRELLDKARAALGDSKQRFSQPAGEYETVVTQALRSIADGTE